MYRHRQVVNVDVVNVVVVRRRTVAVVAIIVIVIIVARRAIAIVVVARSAVAIIFLESIRGHPILVWGSPYRFGDPQTKTRIPESKWGCKAQRIPKPIWGSPNQNGDPRIPIPKRGSPNRFGDCPVTNQKRFGVRSNLGTDRTHPQIGWALKTGTPYRNGDPRIGLGRDLSKNQIGESPKQFGVHSNLGTNIYTCLDL